MSDPILERFRELRHTKGIGVAEPFLAEQVAAFPDSAALRGTWAVALLWRGNLEGAKAELERALAASPECLEARVAEAAIASFEGDLDRAKKICDSLLEAHPESPLVVRSACQLSLLETEADESELLIERLIRLAPGEIDTVHAQVLFALRARSYEKVREILENPPENFRKTFTFLDDKAKLAISLRNFPEAEAYLREAVAMAPEADSLWSHLAQVLSRQGNDDEAVRCADFALEINSRNPLAFKTKARAAENAGDFEEAAKLRERSEQAVPRLSFMAITGRARVEVRKGKIDSALAILKELSSSKNRIAQALGVELRLRILLDKNRPEDLEACWDELSESYRQSPIALAARAKLLQMKGGFAEALEVVESGLETVPDSPELLRLWVDLKAEAAADDEIERACERWSEKPPGSPTTCSTLYLKLHRLGYKHQARRFLEAAKRAYPGYQGLEVLTIGALAETGHGREAFRRLGGLTGHYANVRRRVLRRMFLRRLRSPRFWFSRLFKKKR